MSDAIPRERWSSRGAFIMAAIGSAVGLGNLWRFPYIAYKNGGGAFLIPYFVALLTAGIPLMILEYGLGQKFQGSAPDALGKANKKWKWLGWWSLGFCAIVSVYYAVVMAWTWKYLFDSFTLPWAGKEEAFFFKETLRVSGVDNIGGLVWPLVLGLAITWLLIYIIIKKGVLRVGKVVMLTVPLPVVLLLIIGAKAVTLDGAWEGIQYYLTPNFAALANPQVWLAAYGQVFFSLSLGFGVLIAYASYRAKTAEITNSAFITSFANCGYSFLAGFAVFSIVGFMAGATQTPIDQAVKEGPGLAFVVFPTAIAQIGGAWGVIIAAMFFITLLSLGIDSAFSLVEGVLTGIHDRIKINRSLLTGIYCFVAFLLGLLLCTQSGLNWLDIVDHWALNYGLVVIGLLECVVVGWLYKTGELRNYLNSVSEVKIGWLWTLCVKFVTPIILTVSLVLCFAKEIFVPYGNPPYPRWATMLGGWCLVGLITAAAAYLSGKRRAALIFFVGTALLGASWWLNAWLADGAEMALFATLITGATLLAVAASAKKTGLTATIAVVTLAIALTRESWLGWIADLAPMITESKAGGVAKIDAYAIALTVAAAVVLYGGLAWCLRIALKKKKAAAALEVNT